MARSRKKTPIGGNAAVSDQTDKTKASRRVRRVVRARIGADRGVDALPQQRELSDVWNFAKDGKHPYRSGLTTKQLRK